MAWIVSRLPLDITSETRFLLRTHRTPCEKVVYGSSKVLPGNRNLGLWATIIQLSSIDQFSLVIIEEEIRRTSCFELLGHFLGAIVAKGKYISEFLSGPFQILWSVIRVLA